MRRFHFLTITVIITALLLVACNGSTVPVSPEPTDGSSSTVTTLVVWDQFYRDVESNVMETLNAEFEQAHPGVKIERVVKTLDDLKVTLKLALSEPNGPDLSLIHISEPTRPY